MKKAIEGFNHGKSRKDPRTNSAEDKKRILEIKK
jgi:hypothetical protein